MTYVNYYNVKRKNFYHKITLINKFEFNFKSDLLSKFFIKI